MVLRYLVSPFLPAYSAPSHTLGNVVGGELSGVGKFQSDEGMKLALHTFPFSDCRTQNPILAAAHARSTEKTADIHVPFVQNVPP